MLATIVTEILENKDRDEVIAALEDICSPIEARGWASAGIYTFWDPTTGEILYIGLAVDLSIRFQQHLGRIQCDPAACKIEQITKYFQENKYLGYSVFLQSTLSQPFNARWRQEHGDIVAREEEDQYEHKDDGLRLIKRAEGILIDEHLQRFGARPQWNKINGLHGAEDLGSQQTKLTVLQSFINLQWTPLTARDTLRGLAANDRHRKYEEWLHAVRLWMGITGQDFPTAFDTFLDTEGLREEIRQTQYWKRKIPSPFQPLGLPQLFAN